jgi:hypothetical protein
MGLGDREAAGLVDEVDASTGTVCPQCGHRLAAAATPVKDGATP